MIEWLIDLPQSTKWKIEQTINIGQSALNTFLSTRSIKSIEFHGINIQVVREDGQIYIYYNGQLVGKWI